MKKFLCLFFFCAFVFTCQAETKNEALFSYDESVVTSELAELSKLEDYLALHEGATLVDLQTSNADFEENFLRDIAATYAEPPLGIPSFLWGCVFGVAGLAIVYFVSEDKDETKKALYGCITSTVVGTVLYIALVAAAASTT